jgi:dolichol-phosphate mannosyltransferase
MATPIFLSLVMPAFNEETTIEEVISDHVEVLKTHRKHIAGWEIVCVDDASSDRTSRILERLNARLAALKVIRHIENKGTYQSFADGFAVAKGTHVYATGADGQWPARNLDVMLGSLASGVDLVVGVRLNRNRIYGLKRRLVSWAFNASAQVLFGVKTLDAGSVKLGLRDVFRLDLISRSPFAEAERIIRARRLGYRVDFVPVEFRGRGGGRESGARWSNVVASARDCLRCAAAYGMGRGGGDEAWLGPSVLK